MEANFLGALRRDTLEALHHLDLTLWLQVRRFARTGSPGPALGVSLEALNLLAYADSHRVGLIASSAVLSWKISSEPTELAETLLSAERLVEQQPASAAERVLIEATPTSSVVTNFLLLVREVAQSSGDEVAQLVCGVPQTLISQIRTASRLALQLVSIQVGWNVELRYPSRILIELLQRQHLAHHKLAAIQASIASTQVKASGRGQGGITDQRRSEIQAKLRELTGCARNDNGVSVNVGTSPQPQRRICHTDPVYQQVVALMRAGFSRDVVRLEVGSDIGDKVLQRIRSEQLRAGHPLPEVSYRLQTGCALTGYTQMIQASVLMLIYQKLAGARLQSSVDADALMRALSLFESIKICTGITNPHRWKPIVPSLAYGLAMEMRGGTDSGELAYLSSCPTCESTFFTSIRQAEAVNVEPCAFCRVRDAERINAA